MLIVPWLYPSQYLAAPVFLGFTFLLDPLNARAGAESILGDVREGRYGRLINLLIAGLVCGLAWEFWNYWAGAQVDIHRADPAGAQDLRDAAARLWRVSAVRGRVLHDVRALSRR